MVWYFLLEMVLTAMNMKLIYKYPPNKNKGSFKVPELDVECIAIYTLPVAMCSLPL